jgi:cytidyltransferase-like protein
MSIFGTERKALAHAVARVLNDIPKRPKYFVDNGTLLGLWRDGALIDCDDDFDLGLLVDEKEFSLDYLAELHATLEHGLKSSPYQARIVDSYAQKIEVYDPSQGSFDLVGERYGGANYHHVSLDIQPHVRCGEGVKITHSDFAERGQIPTSVYEPLGMISCEDDGVTWPAPADPKAFLAFLYGYLGHGAVLDPISVLYRKKKTALQVGGAAGAPLRVYTDMCADLFHEGHVNYLKQCKAIAPNVHLIVGLHNDETICSYKRAPICTMAERIAVVKSCIYVDEVVPDAPLQVTEQYMKTNSIGMVVHGDKMEPAERQAMYAAPIEMGKYTEVYRTEGISTTDLIDRIQDRLRASAGGAAKTRLAASE